MKRYQITLDGRTFDVRLLSDPRQERVEVEIDGVPLTVEVKDVPVGEAAPEMVTAPPAADHSRAVEMVGPQGQVVSAPLPGVIKMIAVQPGQQVNAGDELLVIDAMKMDNVIRAPRPGVIGTIFVPEGRQVAHGEPMLEFQE